MMAKSMNDIVPDAMLDKIATATLQSVCSAEPTTLLEATTTFKLADAVLTAGDGLGDYVIANGVTSGRKVAVTAQSNVPIDTSGTATHLAYTDGTNLLVVTTVTSQVLTSGGTVTVPTHNFEIADPA